MTVTMNTQNPPLSVDALQGFEAQLGLSLPKAYRTFLLENDGGLPANNIFSIPGQNNQSGVKVFLSASTILLTREKMAEQLASDLVPIADDDCGNFICLNATNGCVIFWDHELDQGKNTFKLAPSFQDFLNAMKPLTPEDVPTGNVVKAWIDPEFLKSLKE